MKNMYRGMILFMVVMLFQVTILPPNKASASEQMSLTQLSIKVMPEFINPEEWDDNVPSLLVGYHGTFTNVSNEAYEGTVKFSIPSGLPEFTSGYVAQYIDETEEHVQLEYSVNKEEGYITLTLPKSVQPDEEFQFIYEFFSAPIEGVVDRSFTFEYTAESELEDLIIEIYAPYRADDFKVSKEPAQTANSFGVQILVYEYFGVKKGDVHDFDITYSKEDIVTTVEALNDMPQDDNHAGIDGSNSNVPKDDSLFSTENIILLSITVIIVGAFLFVVLRKKKVNNVVERQTPTKKIINKEEEIKKLRKMLAEGKIDEKTYKEKRAKLG